MYITYIVTLLFLIPSALIWRISIFIAELILDYKNIKIYFKKFIDELVFIYKYSLYKNYKKEIQTNKRDLKVDDFKPNKNKKSDIIYISFLFINTLYLSNLFFQTNTSQNLSFIIENTNHYNFLKKLKPRNIVIIKNNEQIYNSLEYKYQKFDEYRYKNVIIQQYYPYYPKEFYLYMKYSIKNLKNDFLNLDGREFLLRYELNFIIFFLLLLFLWYVFTNKKFQIKREEKIYKFILNLEDEKNKQIELNEELQSEKQQLEDNQNLIFDKLKKYKNKLTFKLELLKYQLDNNLIENSIIINLRATLETFLKNKIEKEILDFPYFNNSKKLVDLINLQKEKGTPQKIVTYMHNIRALGNFTAHENQQIEKYQVIAYLQFLLEIFEYYEVLQNNTN